MTSREILETRIKIAITLNIPPDDVIFIHAELYSEPYWFVVETKKYNTILFFSEKPSIDKILKEIIHTEEVIDEWDFDEEMESI